MKHFGDITKIDGHDVPIIDVVIGGSPCQDLSTAGKRAGLEGQRSGLFMEQIRIIKEMRDGDIRNGRTDELVRPRWMLWENVPGSLSSGTPKGEDFRIVLEETARIKDPDAVIPRPDKWTNAGCILGKGWSIAWRILDAQFWGVTYFGDDGVPSKLGTPQRRRRIALVADFNGHGAGEILFERESLLGNIAEIHREGEGTTGTVEDSTGASSYTLKVRGGREVDSLGKRAGKGALVQTELSGTLGVTQDQTLFSPVHTHTHTHTSVDAGDESDTGERLQRSDFRPRPEGRTDQSRAYSQLRYESYIEDDRSPTIKWHGGSYGGGSEVLVNDLFNRESSE